MDRGRKSGYNSTGTGDSDGDTTSDDAQLVVSDSDFSSGRTKTKYAVSENDGRFSFRSLTRNERICLLIGIIALVAVVLIFIIVGVVVSAGGSSGGGENQPWMEIRLPKSITPETYTVSLDVDLKDMFAVCGTVDITASVVSETNYVIIHAKDMTISRAQVIQGEKEIKKESEFFYSENQFYVIELSQVLKVGTISIHMNYNYTLHDDLVGFYRSSYKTAAGDDHWLAVTQFEPTDARRAFPCFDEPALKANFTIQITHDASFNATSNMPPDGTPIPAEGGKVTTHFQPSVKMSTYLVAFVVSDFECVEGNVDDGRVQVRVCSNVDVLDKTHYALQVAVDVISYYEKFFEIEYPLPKQDLFAIPDFAAGAMENWGLITYRETAVLYDNDTDSAASKQRVAVVIAHELAHQWFGNLVTMAWWDGLWLNEGFATFMEYMGTNSTEPDFMMLDQFLVSDLAYALSEDSLLESHPILFHVSNPDEINSLFDGITYSKGGSVIRMLRHHLGEDLFQEGVNLYLEMHKYGNAETSELWDALQEVLEEAGKEDINSGLTVAEIMNTWTNQTGFPVITVTRDGDTLTLTQTRFFAVKPVNQSVIPPSPYDYKWKIPFDFITYTNHSVQKKLIKEGSVSITLPSDAGWIKANIEQQGFYRVNYDTSNWKAITDYLMKDLDSSFLTDSDRGGVLDDAFALSSAGLLDTRVALNLSYYLISEVDYVPWRIALGWFSTFGDRLSLTSVYGKYECFVSGLLEEVVKDLGFDRKDLNHLQTLLRSSVLSAAWQYGNTEVIRNATALFQAWKNNHEPVDKDLKSVVYRAGIAHGTVEDWDYLWNWYEETDDPYEKRLCLGALAESTEPWVLSRYLNYSLSRVRIQDGLSVIGYISGNVHGRYLAWYYVRNNWDYIIEVYGGGSFGFSRLIRTITSAFSTELELKEVEEFFEEHPDVGSGSRSADQAIEIIRGNIAWLNTNLDSLDSYFGECPTTG